MSTPSSELPLTEQVQHRVDERGISYITLNRPDVKNAISPDQRDRVIAMLAEASADPSAAPDGPAALAWRPRRSHQHSAEEAAR